VSKDFLPLIFQKAKVKNLGRKKQERISWVHSIQKGYLNHFSFFLLHPKLSSERLSFFQFLFSSFPASEIKNKGEDDENNRQVQKYLIH
jgi:hypothetical protein